MNNNAIGTILRGLEDLSEDEIISNMIYLSEQRKVINCVNAHLIKTSPKLYNLLHKIMIEHCNNSVLYNEIDELLEEARGEVL